MEIKKFIKNKDITITNDDIDIEALTNELRKGYELSSDVDKKIKSAVDLEAETAEALETLIEEVTEELAEEASVEE